MTYETVIGLEVHSQLLTRSKMFCGCSAEYSGASPNTHVCPICLGMPGTLPVINRRAVELTIRTALALNCEIPEASKFDRKNYPYPDLPKGYQISQYDLPFSRDGWIDVEADAEILRVGMERVHLEEDTAKLTHATGGSLVDFNRAGVPLMEIVSRPDMRSPSQARGYLQKLRGILRALSVSTGNMEEGSFRCDANVSLRPVDASEYGAKVEVKNMNSFRAVQRALEFEVERQTELLQRGERIVQETRGWIEERGVTVSQRSKEQAHDYRYFPEPDLPPIFVAGSWVEQIRGGLAELPEARRERYMRDFGLSRYDAEQIAAGSAIGEFFEQTVALYPDAKLVSNWIQGELFRLQKAGSDEVSGTGGLTPERLAALLRLLDQKTISHAAGKQVFESVYRDNLEPQQAVDALGLAQVSDSLALDAAVEDAVAASPQAAADYRAGKAGAINSLVGQVMKATRGTANPNLVRELIAKRLAQ
jgi:aspartyl-tRNA(Asn)/glutamyl-tRNA(Gln) amidotransferase subunit B